jgi:aspartyl-tRNA(Asn)/glutamyl-tRNA(Gln) amidotransferase subunit B
MEKGAMRCEVNLSLRPAGTATWGTKVEVKNLNSFRSVRNAIEYEVERQRRLLDRGEAVEQVTLGWDEDRKVTVTQRSKEDASDYRYFPEPDLPPLHLVESQIDEFRAALPELPDAKVERYTSALGLPRQDAAVLAEYRDRANYFDAVVTAGANRIPPRAAANWLTGELFRLLNESGQPIEAIKVSPVDLVALLELVENNTINRLAAKEVFAEMWATGQPAVGIIEAKGLKQISDSHVLKEIVAQVIGDHPGPVEQYRAGEEKVLKFLIGQVMRQSKGKANPKIAEDLLREIL